MVNVESMKVMWMIMYYISLLFGIFFVFMKMCNRWIEEIVMMEVVILFFSELEFILFSQLSFFLFLLMFSCEMKFLQLEIIIMINRLLIRVMLISESRIRIRLVLVIVKMFGMMWNIFWKNLMVNVSSVRDRFMQMGVSSQCEVYMVFLKKCFMVFCVCVGENGVVSIMQWLVVFIQKICG